MTPKHPLIELKRTLFLKNRQILTPNCDLRESRFVYKKTLFFFAFSGCACAQHYYSSAPPPGPPRHLGRLIKPTISLPSLFV